MAAALPLALAGVHRLTPDASSSWGMAGAWRYPVGSPYAIGEPRSATEPPFTITRGLERARSGRLTHEGVDLRNGREGDAVHAAANGLVVHATESDGGTGWGVHVVLAHRPTSAEPQGEVFYSVYSHLQRGSLRVREGARVAAGDPLGRVGRTGRASGPHLHFEVRRSLDSQSRWENAEILDPLQHVADRLPALREDSTWARAYLEWAECAGMVSAGARSGDVLTREAWWRMLAAAAVSPLEHAPADAGALRESLVARAVLPAENVDEASSGRVAWKELVRDLERLAELGARTGAAPLDAGAHRATCRAALGHERPRDETRHLATRREPATTAIACLLVADLAGPPPEPTVRDGRGKPKRKASTAAAVKRKGKRAKPAPRSLGKRASLTRP